MNKLFHLVANTNHPVTPVMEQPMEATHLTPHQWMRDLSEARKLQPTLNANQLTSISAMIAYISYQSGKSEFGIERNLADQFHVPNAKCLSANDFDNAIRYLADIISV